MANARARLVRSRRPTFWVTTAENGMVSLAANQVRSTVLITEATLEESPNPTLIRMRGEFLSDLGPTAASGESVRWFAGIYLADSRAVTIGSTALQSPFSEGNSDVWIWWNTGILSREGISDNSVALASRVVIDSKAMRKVGQEQALVGIVQTVNDAGTAQVSSAFGLRVLFKR